MELSGHEKREGWLGPATPSDATFTVAPSVQNGLPTVKPVRLIADAIMDCSKVGDLILDGFGGSGSTLLAAEKTKRRAALIEFEPRYGDVILYRWEKLAKKTADIVSRREALYGR